MDKETWQDRIRNRLQATGDLVRTLTPGMAYGALCAATLRPLMATVQQGELGAVGTLFGIVGGGGGNLIANRIHSWHDKNEAEIAAELASLAAQDPRWREALDALVLELETPRLVQATLAEAEWDRFQDLLRQELAQLGNLDDYSVYLTEIHTEGGAVFEEEVGIAGDFVNRDKITHIYAPDSTKQAEVQARSRYLRRLYDRCNLLPLASLGGDERVGEQVTLSDVYVALNTQTPVPLTEDEKAARKKGRPWMDEESRPLSALEAATAETRLVLLGGPGSGKSTFVRQICAHLAAALLAEEVAPLPGWETGLLPIYTELRALAPRLADLDLTGGSHQEQDERLVQTLYVHWREKLAAMQAEAFGPALLQAVENGRVLAVFDGLDEVPADQRERARRTVSALTRVHPRVTRVIVTCRIRSYTESVRLVDYAEHRLAPFTEEQIVQFCQAWYGAQVAQARFTQEEAQRRGEDLRRAALAPNLAEMATNPMLLTTMAIVHQKEVGLPEERVKLYDLAVQVLMERWQSHRGLALPPSLSTLLADSRRLRKVLERLAYEAHSKQGQEEPDLSRGQLLILLEEEAYLGDVAIARDFLDYVDHRAGLLVGRGGEGTTGHPHHYAFPHRTFQEYLAGCHLLRGRRWWRNFRHKAAEGDTWTLAATLGAEELYHNNPQSGETNLLDLVYALCPVAEPESEQDWRALVWSATMAADLLGRRRIEADHEEPDGGSAYLARLIQRLVRLVNEERLVPVERAEGGRALGRLDDPRPGVGVIVRQGRKLPDIDWVPIEPGPFVMGTPKNSAPYNEETPQFICHLISDPYRMARYPITVAQYACFMAAGGYGERRFWTDAGWDWVQRNAIQGPEIVGDLFQTSNHPQVGVSWFEAAAFCRWLSEELGAVITLPSEAQWERAARAIDGRTYPWGDDFSPERCNMQDTGIGATAAVGLFRWGTSPDGLLDMSGNVWEWCRTQWLDTYRGYAAKVDDALAGDAPLVLRGGSFSGDRDFVRCAVRIGSGPDLRLDDVGFRVVCSEAVPVEDMSRSRSDQPGTA